MFGGSVDLDMVILYIEYAYNDNFDRSGVSAVCNNSFWELTYVYLL